MKRRLTTSRIARYPVLIIIIFVSVGYTTVQAQSIFLKKRQFGVMTFGGYGASDKYGGPVMGLGVSFNGFTELDFSYSSLSHAGINAFTIAISPDFLLRKQSDSFPVNIELTPGFSHTHYRNTYSASGSGLDHNIISFGMAVSGELKESPSVHFVPQLHARYSIVMIPDKIYSYNNIPGKGNQIMAGLDWNIVINLSDNVLMIIDPGFSFAINENSTAGSIAGGLLFR